MNHFGKKLRELRVSRGYSEKEFADRCHLERGNISHVEGGYGSSKHPKISTIVNYARGLQASKQELVSLLLAAVKDILEEDKEHDRISDRSARR